VKQNEYNYHFPYSWAEGIDRLEFAERISHEIMKMLHSPEASVPIGSINQWTEMTQPEKLVFVNACLECFYWIYIMKIRGNPTAYLGWMSATIDQKVATAAGFCSFILGTEFEHSDYQESDNLESFTSEWVN